MRVVSLACSNTEIVCALGCAELLVGVDDHSDYPADSLQHLPRVGPDLGIDIQRVAELRPDLVIASLTVPGHENVVAGLQHAGLPFIAPEPTCIEDVFDDVRSIARHLGVAERGERLAAELRAELGEPVEARPDAPPVLVEWWPKPVIVPGRDSWVTELLARAGGRNPFADREVKSTPISDDEALAARPEAIVISWCGVRPEKYRPDVVQRRTAWHGLPGMASERIHCVSEEYLGRPGPRMVEGLRRLRAVVAALG